MLIGARKCQPLVPVRGEKFNRLALLFFSIAYFLGLEADGEFVTQTIPIIPDSPMIHKSFKEETEQ